MRVGFTMWFLRERFFVSKERSDLYMYIVPLFRSESHVVGTLFNTFFSKVFLSARKKKYNRFEHSIFLRSENLLKLQIYNI